MRWLAEHWFLVVLFAAYSGLLLYHGHIGRRRTSGVTDYYVGGRNMGGVVIGVSFYATYASTNSYVGNAGQGYTYGLPWLLMVVFMAVMAVISWKLVAPRLRRMTADWDSVTLPDFFAVRFASPSARVLAALIIAFASLLYMTAIFKGVGNLLQIFVGIPYEVAIVIVFVIVMFYTAVGGFISVVRTDVIQGLLMVVGSVLIFTVVTNAVGGVGAIFEVAELPEGEALFSWSAAMPFPVLLGILFAGSMKLLVEPRQISRFYALRDERSIRVGIWIAVAGIVVIQVCLLPIGIYAHLLIPSVEDTDLIVPMLVGSDIFSAPLADFLVLAMLAAAMSSLDSVLLVTGATLVRDVVAVAKKDFRESDQLRYTRLMVALLAVATGIVAFNPPAGIVPLTIFSGSLYAACFFPALMLGLHWSRGNGAAVVASFVTGVSTLVLWLLFELDDYVHEVFPAIGLSLIVFVSVALAMPANADARVVRHFNRAGET